MDAKTTVQGEEEYNGEDSSIVQDSNEEESCRMLEEDPVHDGTQINEEAIALEDKEFRHHRRTGVKHYISKAIVRDSSDKDFKHVIQCAAQD